MRVGVVWVDTHFSFISSLSNEERTSEFPLSLSSTLQPSPPNPNTHQCSDNSACVLGIKAHVVLQPHHLLRSVIERYQHLHVMKVMGIGLLEGRGRDLSPFPTLVPSSNDMCNTCVRVYVVCVCMCMCVRVCACVCAAPSSWRYSHTTLPLPICAKRSCTHTYDT